MIEEIRGKGSKSFRDRYEKGEIPVGVYVEVCDRKDGLMAYKVSKGAKDVKLKFLYMEAKSPEDIIGDYEWKVRIDKK